MLLISKYCVSVSFLYRYKYISISIQARVCFSNYVEVGVTVSQFGGIKSTGCVWFLMISHLVDRTVKSDVQYCRYDETLNRTEVMAHTVSEYMTQWLSVVLRFFNAYFLPNLVISIQTKVET